MRKKKTKEKIQALHEELCELYGLEVIPIKWTSTRRGRFAFSYVTQKAEAIKLGIKCWRGLKTAFIHEFAHYLTYAKHGPRECHGNRFYYNLVEVAGAVLGDPSKYDWQSEYPRIRKKWKSDNLTKFK